MRKIAFAPQLAVFLLLISCRAPASLEVVPPLSIACALESFGLSDLNATAELLDEELELVASVALDRGRDGESFSGFVPADPGNYSLDIVFSGVVEGRREFLGRLGSDYFTVVRGEAVTPAFNARLDKIGRPGDGGDEDRDGLGFLDELLWGTDPTLADTDNDEIDDGADCDPTDPTRANPIQVGGSIEDCDGDGARRPDMPYGEAGRDCDDLAATVHPSAVDDCGDGVDQDCNPATCSEDVSSPPSITDVSPPSGATLGCHSQVTATIHATSASVTRVVLVLPDDPNPTGPRTFVMLPDSSDQYLSIEFNLLAPGAALPSGPQTVEIRATDSRGAQGTKILTYTFDFDVPTVVSMTPATIGQQGIPFDVTVEVATDNGVNDVSLWAVRTADTAEAARADAILLGTRAANPAVFSVNPGSLADGDYLLFPSVEDAVGNRLHPSSTIVLAGSDTVPADSFCSTGASSGEVPVRLLSVGGVSSFARVTALVHLGEAIAVAASVDPAARLVSIKGHGIENDGKVPLDNPALFGDWEYGFFNQETTTWVTVSWFAVGYNLGENPVVDADAGNVVEEEPIVDVSSFADSDAVVQAYLAAGCATLTPSDWNFIGYSAWEGQDEAYVSSDHGSGWIGVAGDPTTEIASCDE